MELLVLLYSLLLTLGSLYATSDCKYSNCPKIVNTFLIMFSNKLLVIKAGILKSIVRLANREDPDQTAASEAVWSGSALFV